MYTFSGLAGLAAGILYLLQEKSEPGVGILLLASAVSSFYLALRQTKKRPRDAKALDQGESTEGSTGNGSSSTARRSRRRARRR